MQIFFWIADLIFPISMIFLGIYYKKNAQKPISQFSGLRTKSSMSSKKNWKLAHEIAGTHLLRVGVFLSLYAFSIKILEPCSPPCLSIINNTIYLISFILIGVISNYKISKQDNSTDKSKEEFFILTIGKKLKQLREESQISQEEFAQKLNVTRQTISNWENEKRLPDVYILKNIADIYEISMDELCGNVSIKVEEKEDKTSRKTLALSISLCVVYLIVGIATNHFYMEVFIPMIVFALMCAGMIHMLFKGAIKDNNFGIIAGYDSKTEYNMPAVKKMLRQCDKHIAITTLMTNILLFASAYAKQTAMSLTTILTLYYPVHMTATIMLHNYKAHQTMFVHEKDKNIAKAGWISTIWYFVMIFFLCGMVIYHALTKDIKNNTPEAMSYIGWMMLAMMLATVELFYEQHKAKKYANTKMGYHVGAAFWIVTIIIVGIGVLIIC